MPHATPLLRRLRQRTGVKSGAWAERVEINRNHYVNVEGGHKPGSHELFARCAHALTELLGEAVEVDSLMEAGRGSKPKGPRRPPTKPPKRPERGVA